VAVRSCRAPLETRFAERDSNTGRVGQDEYLILLLTRQASVSHVDRPSAVEPRSRSCDDTAGSRDIVFLPRHELRNKITTRNWNYPRITIAPPGDRGLVCVLMCTEAKAVAALTAAKHARISQFSRLRFFFALLGRSDCQNAYSRAAIRAKETNERDGHCAMQFWTTSETDVTR